MRYPAAETAAKHARILEKASRLFRERGFSDVSVAEIMQATGLTHGPFYNHFTSKEGLMVEAVQHASEEGLAALEATPHSEKGRREFVSRYLSAEHRDCPEEGCLIAALASEIAREPAVQSAMTTHVKAMIAKMASHFPWKKGRSARGEAIRAMSCSLGALILARAIDDEDLSEEILKEAARQ
jgi:TetR/AcrR family transcriptional regulator, transcriptional repressor for nem operon